MEIRRKMVLFFILLFLFINIAQGEISQKIEKTSTITLLNDSYIKIETSYRLDPKIDTFITSEAIESSEKLRNISIRINGEEIPNNEYTIIYLNLTYVALKEMLSYYTNIDKPSEIDIKFETKLNNYDLIKIDLAEINQITYPQVEVNYMLEVNSSNNYYQPQYNPPSSGAQSEFLVTNYASGHIELTRKYKSTSLDQGVPLTLIDNLYYIKNSFILFQEFSRKLDIDVNSKLVKQIYNFKDIGTKGQNIPFKQRLLQFPLIEDPAEHPIIRIKTDKEEYSLHRIEYDQYKEILNKGFDEPFYYLSKDQNSNNTLWIGYNLTEDSEAEITIEVEYDANKFLTTKDNFNYVFKYNLLFPSFIHGYIEFLTIDISKGEFTMDNTNYQSNLITKDFKNSNLVRFKFTEVDCNCRNIPLEIKFYRPGTKYFNYMRYFNIISSIILICLVIIWNFKILPFKLEILDQIKLLWIFIIKDVGMALYLRDNFIDTFKYTMGWMPILILILVYIYLFYLKRANPNPSIIPP